MKLLKLGKPGCLPCVQLGGFLDDLGVEYEDINMQANPEYAIKYGVMSNPVLILLDDTDTEIDRVIGFSPANESPVTTILEKLKGGN